MKITLTKNDVMEILCHRFDIPHTEISTIKKEDTEPVYDEVYWEGNPENPFIGK